MHLAVSWGTRKLGWRTAGSIHDRTTPKPGKSLNDQLIPERGVACERSFGFGRGRRLGEQVALHFIAGMVAEKGELVFRLHTLGGDRFAEAAAECDDRFDDGVSVGFGTDVTHERLVDFDAVKREVLEVAEAGIASAEVVDGDERPSPSPRAVSS
jgi:hypothetical protein